MNAPHAKDRPDADSRLSPVDKPQALVVSDDPVYMDWLRKATGERIEYSLLQSHDVDQVTDTIANAARLDLLFCEFTSATLAQRVSLVEHMQDTYWQIPVVGLGAAENANWVLAAMRAGVRDFLVLGRDDESAGTQIQSLLSRNVSSRTLRDSTATRRGHVHALIGAHANENIAFVGEHLALAFNDRIQKGERAILVDLARPAGAASIFMNLNPSYSVLDALRDGYRCDETLVDAAFSRHTSGLYVLSLPEDQLTPPVLDPSELAELVDVLGRLFAYIVVAVDGSLPVTGLSALMERAHRALFVSDQSILSLRHTKHLLRALRQENCPLDQAALLVDNYRRNRGLEPKNLSQLFELPLAATLTNDTDNRSLSMNSGEPMFSMARKDPFCAAIRELADHLEGQTEAPVQARRPGFFARLRS